MEQVEFPHPILTGWATWYCGSRCTAGYGPDDLVAAAGPLLRTGHWRGRVVAVCRDLGQTCVSVRLVDACWCPDRGGRPTLLDLSSSAFARVAPLERGIIDVTVRW